MKRWLWYAAAVALILAVGSESFAGTDVAELQPVQTLLITKKDGQIRVESDTGDYGEAGTLAGAFEDMKTAASSEIFLDTAEYLLIAPECTPLLPELIGSLRPSCCLCLAEGGPDLAQAGRFLKTHGLDFTLMDYRAGIRKIPKLRAREGRMELDP